MSFQGTDNSYRLFQSRGFGGSEPPSSSFVELTKSGKIPGFLVRPESAPVGCLSSLRALLSKPKLPPETKNLRHQYRDASLTGFRVPGMGLVNSFLLHCALMAALIYLPMTLNTRPPEMSSAFLPPEVIFYPVPQQHKADPLPRIAPPGPGGRPGSGVRPKLAPNPGRTASIAKLTVISKPLHPDNAHQTIIQPSSPPDLRIPHDLQVPNLALGMAKPKKPDVDLGLKKPMQESAKVAPEMAAPKAETNTDYELATALRPTAQPRLAIPVVPLAKPMRRGTGTDDVAGAAAPQVGVASNGQASLATAFQSGNSQPKMPSPGGSIGKPTRRDNGIDEGTGGTAPEMGVSRDGRAVLALGIDPSGSTNGVVLPPGNRWGDFTIAPGAEGSGAPGGRAGGKEGGGGSGGSGPAGDESVGIGSGREGGGGGNTGSPSRISVQGSAKSVGGVALLDSHLEAGMVFPVPASLRLPKSRMIVSAGPMGGGGLGVYGALSCVKIYTIFLPMGASGWTMQYCQKPGSAEAPKEASTSAVLQLEPGLVPPDLDLASRYDFKRLPVPPGKAQKLIVLKGTLGEDGSIGDLAVYQGIVPQMDEAARLAFSRWKFRPATREGKPVALEILIGIPPEGGPARDPQ